MQASWAPQLHETSMHVCPNRFMEHIPDKTSAARSSVDELQRYPGQSGIKHVEKFNVGTDRLKCFKGLAWSRDCPWLLASAVREARQRSFTRLTDIASASSKCCRLIINFVSNAMTISTFANAVIFYCINHHHHHRHHHHHQHHCHCHHHHTTITMIIT